MSAYLCHPDSFDLLASFASNACTTARFSGREVTVCATPDMPDVPHLVAGGVLGDAHERVTGHNAEDVARILRAENIRSLIARYGDRAANDGAGGYEFRRVNGEISPVVVLKTLHCLRYQSCEADDYQQTLASALLGAIERSAINALPGYDDAPWGWTRDRQAVQS